MKQKVLVTGASGGLGIELCQRLIAADYEVFGAGRDPNNLKLLDDMGVNTLQVDFLDKDASKKITQTFRDVDCLVNNAGIFPIKNLEKSSIVDYDEVFRVNVRIPFQLMAHYIPKMKKRKKGNVINILSSSAFSGSPDTALYCASKHALLGLTRSAFLENRGTGVNIFSVSPGSMKTRMGASDSRQDYSSFIDPVEVAKFICFALDSGDSVVYDEVRINRTAIR